MSFSVYSFLNAVFWFNIGLIPIALIQTHGRIVKRYSPVLLGALTVLAGIRVFLPLDATWFLVIDSRHVLRFLQRILNFQLFGIVPVWGLVVLIWLGEGRCTDSRGDLFNSGQTDPKQLDPCTE